MRRPRKSINQINVVPYIDVMLVLLVIFMVTAPLVSPGEIELPSVGSKLTTPVLPLEVTLVPTFLVIHKFEWLNTYQGIAGPLLIDAFGVFLMRQSMLAVPNDYLEAARIDGAGEWRILWQIVLPQCRPALAVLAVFSFRDSWDQFLWPLTVVSVDRFRTYPLGLALFGDDYGNPPTEQMVIAVLATIPMFLLFAILQRAVQRGFGLSGLK